MAQLIASLNVTIDGYCDHHTFVAEESVYQSANELLDRAEAVVLGRNTYGLFEHYWTDAKSNPDLSSQAHVFAEKIQSIRKIVVSKTLDHADWQNSIVISDLRKLDLLKRQAKSDFVMFGSPGLFSMLAKRNMIDEYVIFYQPILAGNGQRLFSEVEMLERQVLKVADTKVFDSGVVRVVYQTGAK